jgi:FolB domain-containing protein
MDKIIIRDLIAYGIIGVDDWERHASQEIRINVELYTDTRRAAANDDIQDCVNYRTVAEKIKAHAETVQRRTVEALAADIADLCLAEAGVLKVRVRVEKPEAISFTASVGVEIERERASA